MLDKEGFLDWLDETFLGSLDTWGILENILDYAAKNMSMSSDQLIKFLTRIIPQVTEEEIRRFVKE